MKKTITKLDGSTETLEGSPKEIADYEFAQGPKTEPLKSIPSVTVPFVQPYCQGCRDEEKPWFGVVVPTHTCGKFAAPMWTVTSTSGSDIGSTGLVSWCSKVKGAKGFYDSTEIMCSGCNGNCTGCRSRMKK